MTKEWTHVADNTIWYFCDDGNTYFSTTDESEREYWGKWMWDSKSKRIIGNPKDLLYWSEGPEELTNSYERHLEKKLFD